MTAGKVLIGGGGRSEYLDLAVANRHGLVTGATGTGKTVTLQVLAEGFSAAGVPVFCADVKGDVAGLAMAGEHHDHFARRAGEIGIADDYRLEAFPVIFWDLFGKQGHPIRTTISDLGPLLLSRLLNLNATQEGMLTVIFKIAAERGLPILDLKDLQAVLAYIADRAGEFTTRYGNISKASVGTMQRALLTLEYQGAALFFGEPALSLSDLMRTAPDGKGVINILAADELMRSPQLYATFLFWLLSKMFDELPEVGNPDKPKLVFFFDEAHLLFKDAPRALLDKIEMVVRLIRSKGVGIYFVSQSPVDVPDVILAQLGNRVQHALRAFTPRDARAVRAAADTFRANPDFSTFDAITNLATGEALISTLSRKGAPSVVQRTLIRPPSSRVGTLSPDERAAIISASPVAGVYEKTVNRESAFEKLSSGWRYGMPVIAENEAPDPCPESNVTIFAPRSGEAFEAMRQTLASGGVQVVTAKDLFLTPVNLAARVIDAAGLRTGDRILEPSAGTGRLIDAAGGSPWAWSGELVAVESNRSLADALTKKYEPEQVRVRHGDFLEIGPAELRQFDRIIMNPPFSRGDDIRHVTHALRFLAEGGRLVAIMSAGVMFRQERAATEFRALVENRGGTIEPLPDDAFKEAGTSVRTVLVTIDAE
ncbi:MAG: DUF853 family protein [Rhizobiaceae bacterium]|nr:DUF853 family protein [Rhizobiaceae bacterium]